MGSLMRAVSLTGGAQKGVNVAWAIPILLLSFTFRSEAQTFTVGISGSLAEVALQVVERVDEIL